MMRHRRVGARSEQQPPTALRGACDPVYPAGFGESAVLAVEDVAVDAALQAVLVVGEGIKAEVEQALAVALPDGGREQVSEKALLVVRVRRLAEEASEGPEGSQLGGEYRHVGPDLVLVLGPKRSLALGCEGVVLKGCPQGMRVLQPRPAVSSGTRFEQQTQSYDSSRFDQGDSWSLKVVVVILVHD